MLLMYVLNSPIMCYLHTRTCSIAQMFIIHWVEREINILNHGEHHELQNEIVIHQNNKRISPTCLEKLIFSLRTNGENDVFVHTDFTNEVYSFEDKELLGQKHGK